MKKPHYSWMDLVRDIATGAFGAGIIISIIYWGM
jgi:hypothetical protein